MNGQVKVNKVMRGIYMHRYRKGMNEERRCVFMSVNILELTTGEGKPGDV